MLRLADIDIHQIRHLQVTHTVLVSPEQLDRICPEDSHSEGPSPAATPFRRLIRDLLLFFEHTYRVSSH